MSEIKLLPCPFCGVEKMEIFEDSGATMIACTQCHTMMEGGTKEDVIIHWNTRKPMERIIKNLEHLCEQTYHKSVDGDYMAGARNNAYHNAIQVIKEVGGLNESN